MRSNAVIWAGIIGLWGLAGLLGVQVYTQKAAIDRFERTRPLDPRKILNSDTCNGVCVVHNSPGGILDEFKETAKDLVATSQALIIDGTCASACTALADDVFALGGDLCITDRTVFWLHQAYSDTANGYVYHRFFYSAPMEGLIARYGDLPKGGFMRIDAAELQEIYPRCSDAVQTAVWAPVELVE